MLLFIYKLLIRKYEMFHAILFSAICALIIWNANSYNTLGGDFFFSP